MPQPVPSDLHVDTLLSNVLIGYQNASYIADDLFQVVPVMKQSDKIPAFNQSFWFRDDAHPRAPGNASRGGGYTVDTSASYFCNRWSRRFEIPDDLRRNADPIFGNLDGDATEFIGDKLLMRREVAFATDFFTTGVWTTDKVGATDFTKWSDYGGSNPIVDVDSWKDTVEALIGIEPMHIAIGKQVWVQVKNHPQFMARIKYTQRAQLSVELAASLLELTRLVVGRSIYTTTLEGTAEGSVTYTRIWGKHALLLYRSEGVPSLMKPTAGMTFVWAVVPNALQYVKRMRNEEREIDIIEGNSYFDQKVTAARAGLFAQNVVA